MAGAKIRGITIEIGADTSGVSKALGSVNNNIKQTQKELKDVERLLKLDPKNTELLAQKQKLLTDQSGELKTKLDTLKKAQSECNTETDEGRKAYDVLEREIVSVSKELENAEKKQKNFSVGLEEFKAKAKEVSDVTGKLADKTKAVSAAAGVAAGGLLGMAVQAGKSADDLNTLSKQSGFTTDELQKWQYASDLVDVSVDSIVGANKKLKSNMASTSASTKELFDQLHVSLTDANGQMRNSTDVFYDVIEALSNIENETERDQVAMKLFGKSADDLAGIIDDGGASLKQLGQEAEDAGLILSQDALDAANQFNDGLDKLKATAQQAFLEAGASLSEELLPKLETLVTLVINVLTWFANLDGGVLAMIVTILALVSAISPLLSLISAMTMAASMLNMTMLPFVGIIALIIGAIGLIVLAITHWQDIVELFKNIWDGTWNGIKSGWKSFTSFLNSSLSAIPGFFSDKWNAALSTTQRIFGNIQDSITSKINGAKDTVKNVIDKIKGFFNFSVSWPHIPLPHFGISPGGWKIGDILKGTIPRLSIDWYGKAMETGIVTSIPTIFGINSRGEPMGMGERGSETLVGTNSLMGMIGNSVESKLSKYFDAFAHGGIKVVLDTGVLVGELTPEIDHSFDDLNTQKGR